MYRTGISIYPEHSRVEENLNYIEKAGKLGFKKLFTCLLSLGKKSKEELIKEFKSTFALAHEYNMEIILDINPQVFENLGISYSNLEFFKLMNADGIRIDERFDGLKESMMSYNKENLKIELNASVGGKYLDSVMAHYPNLKNVMTCHNFYPQRYTGLSLEHFNKCNEQVKTYSLKTTAFVSSRNKYTFGPWPVFEGLPTLEIHRDLPISTQVRHLFATRMINDVIIGNAFASDEELVACSKVDPSILTLDIEIYDGLSEEEKQIIYFDKMHINRGDESEWIARSSATREVFKNHEIKPFNTKDLKRGDIVILNSQYPKYMGELQVVLKDMKNDGRKNVVGRIKEHDNILIEYLNPRRPFKFLK